MLTELLVPVTILIGASILFGIWGEQCARRLERLTRRLTALARFEMGITQLSPGLAKLGVSLGQATHRWIERGFDKFSPSLAKLGVSLGQTLKLIQTGLSHVNILFIMAGIFTLLLLTVSI
jgi:hypothetical protein